MNKNIRTWVAHIFSDYIYKTLTNILLFLGTFWILTDVSWTIVNIINYRTSTNILKESDLLWIWVVLVPFAVTISYVFFVIRAKMKADQINEHKDSILQDNDIIQFYRNIIDNCFSEIYANHKDILLKDIMDAIKSEDWKQVIRIGKYGSRLFLMLEKYDLRITYGEKIIYAAEKIDDIESQATGHIDCIGWSYVLLGDYDKAHEEIKKGLDLIEQSHTSQSNILKCKAERHLVSIALMCGNLDEAKAHRNTFEKYLKTLRGKAKRIMKASLLTINADILVEDERPDNVSAKKNYEKAQKIYISCLDYEREVKIYKNLGRINEKLGHPHKALSSYLVGFWLANKRSRMDEKRKNCVEICRLLKNDPMLLTIACSDLELLDAMRSNDIRWSKEAEFYFKELDRMENLTQSSCGYQI